MVLLLAHKMPHSVLFREIGVVPTQNHQPLPIGTEDDRVRMMVGTHLQGHEVLRFFILVILVGVRETEQAGPALHRSGPDPYHVKTAKGIEEPVCSSDIRLQRFHLGGVPAHPVRRQRDPVERALSVRRDQAPPMIDTQGNPRTLASQAGLVQNLRLKSALNLRIQWPELPEPGFGVDLELHTWPAVRLVDATVVQSHSTAEEDESTGQIIGDQSLRVGSNTGNGPAIHFQGATCLILVDERSAVLLGGSPFQLGEGKFTPICGHEPGINPVRPVVSGPIPAAIDLEEEFLRSLDVDLKLRLVARGLLGYEDIGRLGSRACRGQRKEQEDAEKERRMHGKGQDNGWGSRPDKDFPQRNGPAPVPGDGDAPQSVGALCRRGEAPPS